MNIVRKKIKSKPVVEMPELLAISDVAHMLHVHPNTLRNWERDGLIVAVRIGRRKDRRYRKEEVVKLFKS